MMRIQKVVLFSVFLLGIGHWSAPVKAAWEILSDAQYSSYKTRIQADLTREGIRESGGVGIPPTTDRGRRWAATANALNMPSRDPLFSVLLTALSKGEDEFPFVRDCFQIHSFGALANCPEGEILQYVLLNTAEPSLRRRQVQFLIAPEKAPFCGFSAQPSHFSWNPWGDAFRVGHLVEAKILLEHCDRFMDFPQEVETGTYSTANIPDMLEEILQAAPSELRTQQLAFLIQTVPGIHEISDQFSVKAPYSFLGFTPEISPMDNRWIEETLRKVYPLNPKLFTEDILALFFTQLGTEKVDKILGLNLKLLLGH